MNGANGGVNRACISLLHLQPGERVLEIGPGNGAFVADIVGAAAEVSYTGLDLSEFMVDEAEERNRALVAAGRAVFRHGSSDQMPFGTAAFDKALTVHTLYFWEEPDAHLRDVRRVLQPGGLFCIGFGDRAFMQELPFVPYGFTLYDAAEAQALLEMAGFCVLQRQTLRERGRSNSGAVVDKVLNILLCRAV
ncbi:hypothetical protein GCM10027343_16060 [Noviherbaspirillum agri]